MSQFPSVEFDPETVESPERRAQRLEHLRDTAPVAYSEAHGGFWLLTRYADVLKVLQAPSRYTSGKTFDPETGVATGGTIIPPTPIDRFIPSETDGEEWKRYRGVLQPHFRPEAVEKRRMEATHQTHALIDRIVGSGRIDFVLDLGNPLSAIATMSLMGFPLDDWPRWALPFHEVVYSPTNSPEMAKAASELEWVYGQIHEVIADRRRHPADDLMSTLMADPMDGEPLSDKELFELSVQVLGGAIETTTALTANALHYLASDHEARRRLTEDRSLLTPAFDEFLRVFSPVQNLARTAAADVSIGGCPIAAGDRLLMSFASANRDESVFDCPHQVQIDRVPNRHLAMGNGRHFCLGSHQARMMFEVMMNVILDRIPDYRVLESESQRYPSIGNVNGWINLAAEFDVTETR